MSQFFTDKDNPASEASIIEDTIVLMEQWYHDNIFEEKQNEKDGRYLNIFNFWESISRLDEPKHSKILQFFLTDNKIHGQKKKFLYSLLNMLGVIYPEKGNWEVTAEEGHVDIMIKRKEPFSVIIIENKSREAGDQPHQLYRYWYQNIHKSPHDCNPEYYQGNPNIRILYLAPDINKKYTLDSCTKPPKEWFEENDDVLNYDSSPERIPITPIVWTFNGEIQTWLNDCIEKIDKENFTLKLILENLKQYFRNLSSFNMTGDSLRRAIKLFNDNEDRWNAFIELCSGKDKIILSWIHRLFVNMQNLMSTDFNWKCEEDNDGWNIKLTPEIIQGFFIEIRFYEKDIRYQFDPNIYDINNLRENFFMNEDVQQKLCSLNAKKVNNSNCLLVLSFSDNKFLTNQWNWGNETVKVAQELKNIYLEPILNEEIMINIKNMCHECKKQ